MTPHREVQREMPQREGGRGKPVGADCGSSWLEKVLEPSGRGSVWRQRLRQWGQGVELEGKGGSRWGVDSGPGRVRSGPGGCAVGRLPTPARTRPADSRNPVQDPGDRIPLPQMVAMRADPPPSRARGRDPPAKLPGNSLKTKRRPHCGKLAMSPKAEKVN